jgi:two-component system chemotaxis sensor kinase CheA
MTDELQVHRQAFREEAGELLSELETSLLEWENCPDDQELLGRIFRAMHTIKGSGAMFGFDAVAEFTHEVESALDRARSGELACSPQLIDLTLRARDHIRCLLDESLDGPPADKQVTRQLRSSFQELLEKPAGQKVGTAQDPEDRPGGAEKTFRIEFRPHEDLFANGTDPLLLLDELRGMGQCAVIAHMQDIPALEEYDSASCYTYWDIILTTSSSENEIRDVFIFVEDMCKLRVEVIDTAGLPDEEAEYKRLGEILLEKGDITTQKLQEILHQQPRLGELLIEKNEVPPGRVKAALREQKQVRAARQKRQAATEFSSIRVPSQRLDILADLVGEMVSVQARLTSTATRRADAELNTIAEQVERLTTELRHNTMIIRMLPIGALFSKFKRLVRDLSRDLGKEVEMVTVGEETELDKTVIERLGDPLVHLIRNSVDHGIESPAMREAAGKPPKGVVTVTAVHSGAYVLIQIQDDGAGLDPEVIRAKALEKGLIEAGSELSRKQIFNLIFEPGFSTAESITDVSGRGVGMDVVRSNIRSLKGEVDIDSVTGQGTTITLKLPLTLAIIDGLLVTVAGEFFVIPLSHIEECVELTQKDLLDSNGRHTVTVRGELVPYVKLKDWFDIQGDPMEIEQVVITRVENSRLGLVVDRVIGNHQTMIKSLGPMFKHVAVLSGATILGDGTLAFIVDLNILYNELGLQEKEIGREQ